MTTIRTIANQLEQTAQLIHNARAHLDQLTAANPHPDSVRPDDGSRSTNGTTAPEAHVIAHNWIYAQHWLLNRMIEALDACRRDIEDEARRALRMTGNHQPDHDLHPDTPANTRHRCNNGTGKKLEGWTQWHIDCTNIVTDNEIIDGMCHDCFTHMNVWRITNGYDPITRDSQNRHYRHEHHGTNGRFIEA